MIRSALNDQARQRGTDPAPVLVHHADNGVPRITFNRPAQRNAMNRAARAGIVTALDECRGRAKVIVLAGNGPAFCTGMDPKEDPSTSTGALGGGSTLINTADLAIAAEEAQIGMPEIGFGLYPTQAGPAAQLRLSKKRAAGWCSPPNGSPVALRRSGAW